MQYVWISELAALQRGGRLINSEVGEAQNASIVEYNDRMMGIIKTLYDVPEFLHPPKFFRYNMDADGLQSNGSLRQQFDGRNAIAQGGNPIIDMSVGTWSAPMDSWTKDAEISSVGASAIVAGTRYKISTVGTTDFTLIGASSNTVGVHFIATGSGSGTGSAAEAIRWTENVAPGDLFVGKKYRIESVGTTTAWVNIGAASGALGEVFVATADGSGDGQAQQIAQSGDFIVGCWYSIDTVGTTDFTLIGASSNTVGVMFQATGKAPGGTGVATVTRGARLGDSVAAPATISGAEYQDIYCSVYDYKNEGTNRLVRIRSDDGFATIDSVAEITASGSNFGSTVADVVQRPGTDKFYMFHGQNSALGLGYKKIVSTWDSSVGGDWTATGSEIELSTDDASPMRNGMPVGKVVYFNDTTVWFAAPCSQDKADKPEVNLIFHADWDDLDVGIDPALWDFAPAIMRGPNHSGVWNTDSIWLPDGSARMVCNVFGRDSFDAINTDAMKELRDNDQYHEMGAGSHKSAAVSATVNTLAITDPTYRPFTESGEVRLSFGGFYMAAASTANGANLVLTRDPDNANAVFIPVKEGDVWWKFKLKAAPTLALSTGGNGVYANNRAVGLPFEFHDFDNAISGDEDNFRFAVIMLGDESPTTCYLQNCRSSLAVSRDCSQQPLLWNDPTKIWNIEVLS